MIDARKSSAYKQQASQLSDITLVGATTPQSMIHQSFKSNVHRVPAVNKQKVEKTTSGLSRWR